VNSAFRWHLPDAEPLKRRPTIFHVFIIAARHYCGFSAVYFFVFTTAYFSIRRVLRCIFCVPCTDVSIRGTRFNGFVRIVARFYARYGLLNALKAFLKKAMSSEIFHVSAVSQQPTCASVLSSLCYSRCIFVYAAPLLCNFYPYITERRYYII